MLDSLFGVSDKFLGELRSWLEQQGFAYKGAFRRPVITATINAAQAIPNVAATQVVYNTTESSFDPGSVFSLNVATGALTVNQTGWYEISSFGTFAAGAGATRLLLGLVAGVEVSRGFMPAGFLNPTTGAVIVKVTAAQAITIQAYQDSGGLLNLATCRLSVLQVST